MKKYRFFFHYNRNEKKMSVHYRKRCTLADDIICNVACSTKWNKTQPHLVLQGFATSVRVLNSNIILIE